jgi:hypothetical protein
VFFRGGGGFGFSVGLAVGEANFWAWKFLLYMTQIMEWVVFGSSLLETVLTCILSNCIGSGKKR